MKVLIKKGGHLRGFSEMNWAKAMREIEGQWIEIETKYLFNDQYSTVGVRHASNGLRIMEADVADIRDDARIGRSICRWCNRNCPSDFMFCPHCGEVGYLRPFTRREYASSNTRQ
jgi:hypothetical protein